MPDRQPQPSADILAHFKREHEGILHALDGVLGRVRSCPQAPLQELSQGLFAHFEKQGKDFYQKLLERHPSDRMIEFLSHDLKDLKIKCLVFFETHGASPGNKVRAGSFPKEFMELKDAVVNRLKIEEEYLFPLLEQAR